LVGHALGLLLTIVLKSEAGVTLALGKYAYHLYTILSALQY